MLYKFSTLYFLSFYKLRLLDAAYGISEAILINPPPTVMAFQKIKIAVLLPATKSFASTYSSDLESQFMSNDNVLDTLNHVLST